MNGLGWTSIQRRYGAFRQTTRVRHRVCEVRAVLPVRESLDSRTACAEGEVLMAIAIGSAAPAFECQSHTGATLKLADYAGKKLLIWFYPRACTGG